jgi:hypothetical protein
MSDQKPTQATVRRGVLRRKPVPVCLSIVDSTCDAAAKCPEVLSSPVAQAALLLLQDALATTHGSLSSKLALAQQLMAATKALNHDFQALKAALGTFEAAVAALAKGSGALINKAGLPSRDLTSSPAELEAVAVVNTSPGKHAAEAILQWPAAPGATGYALEVNFTPQDPDGTWLAYSTAAGRRRVVKGPTPGCQFLVRVAAVASDGTRSAWSAVILATAR